MDFFLLDLICLRLESALPHHIYLFTKTSNILTRSKRKCVCSRLEKACKGFSLGCKLSTNFFGFLKSDM